jgi:fibronectin type 3 domain-containing protein
MNVSSSKYLFSFVLGMLLTGAPLANAQTGCPTGGCTPPPLQPPNISTGGPYCGEIYNELNGVLTAFNGTLSIPPTWIPVSLGPTIFPANLQVADANTGPAIGGTDYLTSVLPQLYAEKAMGAQAILLQIGFPAMYAPFLTYEKLTPANYTNFYKSLSQAIHSLGMKVIVENDILLANDVQAGWGPTLQQYFSTLTWNEYIQARASMAATIAETMEPDYLILAEEPDTESSQSGQANLLNAIDAAAMVQAEITAVRSSSFPNEKIGAGFGAWPQSANPLSIPEYIAAYITLPMDFLDSHIYPINDEFSGPVITNILTIASAAAAVGMPVSMSEYWAWKMENAELNNVSADTIRGRNVFSFWAPIDELMSTTMQTLAGYTNFVFMANDGPDYYFTYETFAGTTSNGGLENCTCATGTTPGSPTYCDSYDLLQVETQQAKTATQSAGYSATGFAYYNSQVPVLDTIPPAQPTGVTASPAYSQATLSWNLDTDNVGVAGYNVYRCTATASPGPCNGSYAFIGVTTIPTYTDPTLTQNTAYNYEIQAFDMANNTSPVSTPVSVLTFRTSTSSPTNLVATTVSAQEISLTWTAPPGGGVSSYLVFSGPSQQGLAQVATVTPTKTCPGLTSPCYVASLLSPGTMYFFGVEAQAAKVISPMSNLAYATTSALPNPPSNLTATPSSSTEIGVSWAENQGKNSLPVSGYTYQIWEGTAANSLAKVSTTATGGALTYTGRSLTANTTYYYEIVAVDADREDSIPSSLIAVTTPPLPAAPVITSITAPAAKEVVLTWTWSPSTNGLPAARFEINCGLSPEHLSQVGTEPVASGDSFTWRSAVPGTLYYCDAIAVDTGVPADTGFASVPASVSTPPMPVPPTVTATASSSTKVVLSWSETLPPKGLAIQTYTIYKGTSPTALTELVARPGTTTTYTDTAVTGGKTYYYAITATDTGRDVSSQSSPPTAVTTPGT